MENYNLVLCEKDFEVTYDGNGCAIVKHILSDSMTACGKYESKEKNTNEAILLLASHHGYRTWLLNKLYGDNYIDYNENSYMEHCAT